MSPNELAEAVELDNSAQDQGAEQTPAKSPDAGIVDDTDTEDQATQEDEEDEAETDQEDATEDDSDEDAEDQPPKKSKKRSAQARINEMRRRQAEAEREAAYWRGVAEAAKAKPEQQAQQAANAADPGVQVPPTRPAPTLEDHDYDQAAWVQDYTTWTIEQNQAKTQAIAAQQAAQQKALQQAQQFEVNRVKTNETGISEFDDYEQVVFSLPETVLDTKLASAAFEADQPHRVLYWLGRHPKEAAKISRLSPEAKAVAIGRIDAKVAERPAPKTRSPVPSKPVRGHAPSKMTPAQLAKKNPAAYIKLRNEGKIE
jgi:hypothetical protein